MQIVSHSSLGAPELNSFFPQDGYHGLTQTSFLGANSQKSTDIALVTAEGDKITISAKSSLQAEFASYDYRGRLNGGVANLQGQSLQVSAENSFSIAVDGDLSKEELKDIQKLVAKIEKLGANFFSRPLENSLAKTLELGNLDSIASFEANLSYSKQLTVAQVAKEEITDVAASTPESVDQFVDGSEASSSPIADGQTGPAVISADSVQNFIKQLLETARDSKVNEGEVAEKLPKFLAKLFKKLAKDFQFEELKLKLADHIHNKIAQGLKPATAQTPTMTAQ